MEDKKKDKKKSGKHGKSKSSSKKTEEKEVSSAADWKLTDFERQDTLGTGTFGRVFLVTRESQYYALKVLKKSVIVRLKQVQHIFNERNVLNTSDDCPFIVKLEKCFQDQKNLYFVMEYVLGGELFTHLRAAGRFSGATTRFYAAEIVLALEYLHKKNIIYRDLKPENILLDRKGNIKITDFGFAKQLEDRTFTLCGTPEYLAPEVIKGKGYGTEVDWWALGVLIFEMLAGYPPFYDENPFGIYEKILLGRLVFPSHFDSASRDLIKKLLAPDRTRRFGNMRDGTLDLKKHRFFKGIDWEALYKKQVAAPIVPEADHEGDTVNFEDYDDEGGYEVCTDPQVVDIYADIFADFA